MKSMTERSAACRAATVPGATTAPGVAPSRPHAAAFLAGDLLRGVFSAADLDELCRLVDFVTPPDATPGAGYQPEAMPLADIELIVSGWGMRRLEAPLLDRMPRLRAVFYAAGSISGFATPEMWHRGIRVVTASAANAVPVAEFSAAMILLCLKRTFHAAREVLRLREFQKARAATVGPGGYHSTVGLVSLGLIGRLTIERLRGCDLRLLAHDPFIDRAEAERLGVTLVSLEQLFTDSDVVSLHAPWLPQTEGMISGALIASMRQGAALINTARGAIVREDELVEVLRRRPDLQAVLDVTYPEPPAAQSPLFELPNVLLTPHLAGSVGRECERMGRLIVDEVGRYVRGEPLRHAITADEVARTAHGTTR